MVQSKSSWFVTLLVCYHRSSHSDAGRYLNISIIFVLGSRLVMSRTPECMNFPFLQGLDVPGVILVSLSFFFFWDQADAVKWVGGTELAFMRFPFGLSQNSA